MTFPNPFTERGRITDPAHFVGRWGELSIIFDRIETRRPVLLTGVAGIGKSSLLTHIVQSAAANLEAPELRAFYLDLHSAESAEQIYGTLIQAFGEHGDTPAALEVALATSAVPVLCCLDHADGVLAEGWGIRLLEALARMARGGVLMLVVAITGPPPLLSERFAALALGAFAPAELRLFAEAYLEGSGVSFTPAEISALATLSAGHPAYLQRACYHLYRARSDPSYEWRAAYLAEVRVDPVPGAPLPPAIFEGEEAERIGWSQYDERPEGATLQLGPPRYPLAEPPVIALIAIPILIGLMIALLGYPWIGGILGTLGALLVWAVRQRTQG